MIYNTGVPISRARHFDAASDTFRVRMAMQNPLNQIPAGLRCSARLTGPAPTPGEGPAPR